jgi:hypothetical protein
MVTGCFLGRAPPSYLFRGLTTCFAAVNICRARLPGKVTDFTPVLTGTGDRSNGHRLFHRFSVVTEPIRGPGLLFTVFLG